jgi:diaminopropionate ammonia-lyase
MAPILERFRVRHFHNPRARAGRAYGAAQRRVLSEDGFAAAAREITRWPGYAPTPLVRLDGLARAAGISTLWYKDEGERFGLGSFKALGGAYAVFRVVADELARRHGIVGVTAARLASGKLARFTRDITVTTATDGNHGRSVAWGAQLFGCRAVIFIHRTVSVGRAEAIARYGAEVVRVDGNYDDSVREAARQAKALGWFVISDTSWRGYREVPRLVMYGYGVMAEEAVDQLAGTVPTHVFAQGGVGGLAAALFARLWMRWGKDRPRFVVVEPATADCLYRSAAAGKPTKVPGDADSLMAGLAAGEVSQLAWRFLDRAADDFLAIPDAAAVQAMRLLVKGIGGDRPAVGGEAGVAGLAGLLAVVAQPGLRKALGLGPDSRVLVIGSEGDTDPALYKKLVGRSGDAVRTRAAARTA